MSEIMLEKWYIHKAGNPPKKHKKVLLKSGFIEVFTRSGAEWKHKCSDPFKIIAYTNGELVESKRK